jgi:hypothetical protein
MTRTIGLLFTLTVASAAELPRLRSLSSNLPLSFEPNRGQTDARVQYVARGKGYALFLTRAEAVLSLSGGKDQAVVRLKPAGANRHARMEALDPQPGKSNYFIGNDPKQWRTDVPNFGRVRYDEV